MYFLNKKGFSLLELILVLGIGTSIAFIKFQDMISSQESLKAEAAGQQIKQIGEAVNGYINIRYDKIAGLTASSGNGTDPGPRTCSGNICTITYQTLINEGLLPSTYVPKNSFGSDYVIKLKRSGSGPNYIVDGLISTNASWIEGGNIRYDLLGKSMQAAGIDSGMTKSNTLISGYSNSWTYSSSDFPSLSKTGILGYRVGYNSSMYSVYLRRDGTLPMTGNLNMGGQSVYNAQDITATGNTVSGTLRSTGATTVGSTLNVAGSTTLSNTTINGTLNVNNTIASSATITGANITSQAETYTQNWFRTMGDGGIYFQKYGGGWNMTDTNTITAYGGKNIQTTAGFYGGYIKSSGNLDVNGTANIGSIVSNNIHSNANITAAGQIISGSLVSNGRTTVGEFIQLNGTATVGAGCSPNGLIGKDSTGAILSCSSGVWKSAGKVTPTIATFSITETKTTQNISGYDYCSIGIIQQDNGGPACYVENKGNKQWKLYGKADYDNSCTATCMVFN